jgi:Na+-translocating ferredoxin:NAD+ oxidoreductase RnfA subunit
MYTCDKPSVSTATAKLKLSQLKPTYVIGISSSIEATHGYSFIITFVLSRTCSLSILLSSDVLITLKPKKKIQFFIEY